MKKVLATAIIALAPTTAMAADSNEFDGFASIALGYNSLKDTGGSWVQYRDGALYDSGASSGYPKADGLDVEARVTAAVPLGGNFAAQFDGDFTHTVYKYSGSSSPAYKLDGSTLAAHAFWRDPAKGLVGVVAQRTGNSSNYYYAYTPTKYYIGGEGQYYVGNFTLYGQATYGFTDSAYDWNKFDGVNLGLQARYYAQPNLALTLKGGYEHAAANNDYTNYSDPAHERYSTNTWLIGAKGEYRLSNSRASLFIDADYRETKMKYHDVYTGYDGVDYYDGDYSSNRKSHDFRAMVGVKLNFGSKTLLDRDRSGASLDPVRPLTNDMWSFEM